jgi:alpha-tubulin suppressor-like RCC1 family protein
LNDKVNRNSFSLISGTWNDDGYYGGAGILGPIFEPMFSSGSEFSFAIDDGHLMSSTGENDFGQLGLGDSLERDEFESVDDSIPTDTEQDRWDYVRCGKDHVLALKIVGSLEIFDVYDEPLVCKGERVWQQFRVIIAFSI